MLKRLLTDGLRLPETVSHGDGGLGQPKSQDC